MNTQTLPLKQIRIDGGTQPRVEINEEVVAEYAEQLRQGAAFPPVTVFFDGAAWWLADGFHRYHAHRRVGRETMVADLHDGGLREAILYSVGANTEHGLRRTNEDKRKAVQTMLTHEIASMDENGNSWANRDIARRCCVDEKMVRRIREILTAAKPQLENAKISYTTKHGTKATMNTAKIGRSQSKRKKQYGGISPHAFKPVRTSEPYEPKAAIDLPYKPFYAANAIISVMGQELAVEIAEQILQITKGSE
ncbi:MAG: hypothetical protein GXY41_05970 [Phycisphaerae bacterium]|nr:hypothetical protein [Phycisphaerae bacterium]